MTRISGFVLLLLATTPDPFAAEFRELAGASIRARSAGMALTDGVHWRLAFRRDGSLPSISLGKARLGSWRVEGDRLCMKDGIGSTECYAVWSAGPSIQLRPDNDAQPTEEGILERP